MTEQRSPHTLGAALRRQAVLTLALLALAVIVAVGVLVSAPVAARGTAALLGVLAVLRVVLPVRSIGALAVRSRGLDVAVMAVLAIGLAVLSTSPNL